MSQLLFCFFCTYFNRPIKRVDETSAYTSASKNKYLGLPNTKKAMDMIKPNAKVILAFVLNRIFSSELTSLFGWLIGPAIIIIKTDMAYRKYENIGSAVKCFTINNVSVRVVHDSRKHDK